MEKGNQKRRNSKQSENTLRLTDEEWILVCFQTQHPDLKLLQVHTALLVNI